MVTDDRGDGRLPLLVIFVSQQLPMLSVRKMGVVLIILIHGWVQNTIPSQSTIEK